MKIATFFLALLAIAGVVLWKYRIEVAGFLKAKQVPVAGNQTPSGPSKLKLWLMQYIVTILLVVIGIVLLWWSYDTSAVQVGSWGKNHRLWFLVLWGILAALIALHTSALGKAAEVLQWVVAGGVLLALFLGSPVGEWFTKDEPATGSTTHKAATACQPFVSTEVRSCVLTETAVVMTAGQETRAGEFEFCVVKPASSSYDSKPAGPSVFQIRSTGGAFPIQYKLMKGGEKCPEKF